MRGLFKLESARIWGSVLIVLGVLALITAFIMQRSGFARMSPMPDWEAEILALIFGLGIVFILVGITVKKVCSSITNMMQTYDEEIHKKLNATTNTDSE